MNEVTQRIMNVIETIVKGKNNKRERETAIEGLKKYFDKHKWPIRLSKERTIKAMNELASGEIDIPFESQIVDMIAMQSRKMPNITPVRKKAILELVEIIKESKTEECAHVNFGIAPFMHGGGFSPIFAMPELICKDCGLNVTLYPTLKLAEYGIKIESDSLAELNTWATKLFKNQDQSHRVHSANAITEDPIYALQRSIEWDKPIPVKITNKELFESKSGS